jgi:hypothetical protein
MRYVVGSQTLRRAATGVASDADPSARSRGIHQHRPRRIATRTALPVRRAVTPFEGLQPAPGREVQEAMH